MRKILVILFIVCRLLAGAQDNTSAMLKQIALLQVYIGYLEKGYDIARKGLRTIADIKDGNWKMDIAFFSSLRNVNPKVRDYVKVAGIFQQQVQIVQVCSSLRKLSFNTDELSYIHSVCDHIVSECGTVIDELLVVLKNGTLTMSDDERISAIDPIYETVTDQYSFIKDFSERARLLLRSRLKDKNDINVSKLLRGL
jgi:hypothetical protein